MVTCYNFKSMAAESPKSKGCAPVALLDFGTTDQSKIHGGNQWMEGMNQSAPCRMHQPIHYNHCFQFFGDEERVAQALALQTS
eukprot:1136345-Pelagomonas_calceolata.AAC.2